MRRFLTVALFTIAFVSCVTTAPGKAGSAKMSERFVLSDPRAVEDGEGLVLSNGARAGSLSVPSKDSYQDFDCSFSLEQLVEGYDTYGFFFGSPSGGVDDSQALGFASDMAGSATRFWLVEFALGRDPKWKRALSSLEEGAFRTGKGALNDFHIVKTGSSLSIDLNGKDLGSLALEGDYPGRLGFFIMTGFFKDSTPILRVKNFALEAKK
jgi:hypothetical protein